MSYFIPLFLKTAFEPDEFLKADFYYLNSFCLLQTYQRVYQKTKYYLELQLNFFFKQKRFLFNFLCSFSFFFSVQLKQSIIICATFMLLLETYCFLKFIT